MKILGIGVDIVQNSRIKKLITNEKFLLRIFTNDEINKSKSKKIKLLFFLKDLQLKKHFLKHLVQVLEKR